MAVEIRTVEDSDWPAIADLTNHYIEHTAIHFGYDPVTPNELRELWWPKRDLYPFLVAADGTRFLGYAKAGVWRERAAYKWTAEVGVYVARDTQGAGVGTRLYQALIDACRERGFHSLVGGITLPNEPSVRLHERVGFVKVAHFAHAGYKFGAWHDVGFWQVKL
ncbi:MAG: N-acetyltransferase [Phycisphaerae bacterium]|nr:N-acetyltransferase [Phycisphaerae bacterium]